MPYYLENDKYEKDYFKKLRYFEDAINIFGGFNNTNDNLLKTQYMESLIANNQEEKIIEIYQQLKSKINLILMFFIYCFYQPISTR